MTRFNRIVYNGNAKNVDWLSGGSFEICLPSILMSKMGRPCRGRSGGRIGGGGGGRHQRGGRHLGPLTTAVVEVELAAMCISRLSLGKRVGSNKIIRAPNRRRDQTR